MREQPWPVLCAFLLGLLLGATLMNLRQAGLVDRLYLDNSQLQFQIEVKRAEIQKLQEASKSRRQLVITGVDVQVEIEGAGQYPAVQVEAWRAAVEKNVRELLKHLQGRPVEGIDYTSLPQVINGRELRVQQRLLLIRVDLVVVTERLYVRVKTVLR